MSEIETAKEFVETPVAPPEWDMGVYTVFDNGNLVGLLWVVTNNGNKLDATEYWGLSPNWVWPSSTNTNQTVQFKYSTACTITNTTQFKAACDAEFGSGNTTYQKHTVIVF